MLLYLKWGNEVIGTIQEDYSIKFNFDTDNDIVSLYVKGKKSWSSAEFENFLMERIVSRERRDIEKILFRCGLSEYNIFEIAKITRAINAKDLFWIAQHPDEKLETAMTEVFDKIFNQKIDMVGDSINTPEGCNIKRYGVYNGQYGIFKNRLSPLTTDVESEAAVYLLAEKLGVSCCPAYKVSEDMAFSAFMYNFSTEYIVHFRRLFSNGERSENEYLNLMKVRPQYKEEYAKMFLLDFITRQDDRHLSNFAIKIKGLEETFYPLYDNGRSLFYEDTDALVEKACSDVALYATTFGYEGTYYDHLKDLSKAGIEFGRIANLKIQRNEIEVILKQADFTGYRYDGAVEWICKAIELVKNLDKKRDFILPNNSLSTDRNL